jgi:hypothetical protein
MIKILRRNFRQPRASKIRLQLLTSFSITNSPNSSLKCDKLLRKSVEIFHSLKLWWKSVYLIISLAIILKIYEYFSTIYGIYGAFTLGICTQHHVMDYHSCNIILLSNKQNDGAFIHHFVWRCYRFFGETINFKRKIPTGENFLARMHMNWRGI